MKAAGYPLTGAKTNWDPLAGVKSTGDPSSDAKNDGDTHQVINIFLSHW